MTKHSITGIAGGIRFKVAEINELCRLAALHDIDVKFDTHTPREVGDATELRVSVSQEV